MMMLVLLDLSSAFDLVDHELLLQKLQELGVKENAHEWFECYLSGRSQKVSINGVLSDELSVTMGVPQGSVLGPVLFIIYMMGVGEVIHKHGFTYKIYADDIQIYRTFLPPELNDIAAKMERCIEDVKNWLQCKLLILNGNKTEFILFGTKHQLKRYTSNFQGIHVAGEIISCKEVVRDLGVLLDCHLTLQNHITNICRKAFINVHLISRVSRSMDIQTRRIAVNALVCSHLEYCAVLLHGIPKKLLAKMERVLKSALRVVIGFKRRDPVTHLYPQYNWSTMQQRIHLRTAKLMYKIQRFEGAPQYLKTLFTLPCARSQQLRSQDQQQLAVPRVKSSLGDRSFSVHAARTWSNIALATRTLKTFAGFCIALKTLP
jgi:hypothetical protein